MQNYDYLKQITGINYFRFMEIYEGELTEIAKDAGRAILTIYNDKNLSDVVDYKSDDSPLTLADKASHEVIMKALQSLYPDIPIISEEGEIPDYSIRKHFDFYWLIDPLDGTKEFINRNGQFTVNIALIHNHKTVFGIVYAPVTDELYLGNVSSGKAFKLDASGQVILKVNNRENKRIAVRSKSHASVEEEEVLKRFDAVDSISVGSSLKFCMVAEGKADLYYRHGPTMEWDTAAGQAVVEAAGGGVYRKVGPEAFKYNRLNMLNGSFLCLGFSETN